MTEPDQAVGAEQAKPTSAGLYDAYLGGTNHTLAEAAAVERLRQVYPELEEAAWSNRGFHQRAAKWLAEQGLQQFIDIGSGLPTQNNTHEVVQRVTPDARVVYVDIDPTAAALGRDLLLDNPNTAFVNADVRDRDAVLGDQDLRKLIDLNEPVALVASAVFHFVSDAEDPWGLAASYTAVLAPGSYLALSHGTMDKQPQHRVQTIQDVYRQADRMIYSRSRDQVEWFFTDLDLVPPYEGADPKVVFAGIWGAEDPVAADDDSGRWFYGGVAQIQ